MPCRGCDAGHAKESRTQRRESGGVAPLARLIRGRRPTRTSVLRTTGGTESRASGGAASEVNEAGIDAAASAELRGLVARNAPHAVSGFGLPEGRVH